jgi:hypothetical protein
MAVIVACGNRRVFLSRPENEDERKDEEVKDKTVAGKKTARLPSNVEGSENWLRQKRKEKKNVFE